MLRPVTQKRYSARHLPPHRVTSQNFEDCIQIHSPTSPQPIPSPEQNYRENPRPRSDYLLHPSSARYPPGRLPQIDETAAKSPFHGGTQKLPPSKPIPLRTHRNWHRSVESLSTRKSIRKGLLQVDDYVLAVSVTMFLALLVSIGLPLGAILPPKYVVPLPVNVLLPFYVDPVDNGWARLIDSVIEHPDTNFTVILSPSHGPGTTVWPSGTYVTELKKLNKLPNVQTVGYIDIQGGRRDNATVRKEIETYAGWNSSDIAIAGIFFDHTPSEEWGDQANGTARAYLRNISATVKQAEGFDEPRLVIHNPGTIPNASMTMESVDLTVVFEGAYRELPSLHTVREDLMQLQRPREDFAYCVHSVPKEIGRRGVRKFVDQTKRSIEWLYMTDESSGEDMYRRYSSTWEMFLDLSW